MVSKNEKTSSFESGVLQIRRKSNKIDKNEKFLNREFNKLIIIDLTWLSFMLKWVKQIGICRFINLHICLLHKKVLF